MTESLRLAHPELLLGLLLLPLWFFARRRLLERGRVVYPPLQYRSGTGGGRLASWTLTGLELLLLALLILALAGPHRESTLDLVEDEGIDVVLALDISLSMMAEDFPPNRLAEVRRLAAELLRRSGGHRMGLVVFAKDSFVQSPLTTDRNALFALLDAVTIRQIDHSRSGGTAIGDALLVAGELLRTSRIEGRDQAIVLLTDGESNLGAEPLLAADYLRHLGARLYAIGIGGTEPVEVFVDGERLGGDAPYLAVLDDAELRALVERTGGGYFRAIDSGALEEVFAELGHLTSTPLELRQITLRRGWADRLALAAFPLFAACLALGGLVLRRPYR